MNARNLVAILVVALMVMAAERSQSQGFAGLGSSADGFAVPQAGLALSFPADHGAHPDYRIEWWYVTANLQTPDGRIFGTQWTLFRSALTPGNSQGFSDPQIWIGHAAVTTPEKHYFAERLGRGGVGQAGVSTEPFRAWIDDWRMESMASRNSDLLSDVVVTASGSDFSYDLNLKATGPLVLQGDRGFSVKSQAGQASYYYSQPFYRVSGVVNLSGSKVNVTGKAWLDREWSSQPLASNQTGWDWFSLHLDTGEKVMAFRLRDDRGGFISANWIAADGRTTPLKAGDMLLKPIQYATIQGREIPVGWQIQIPEKSLDIKTKPLNERSWMGTSPPYWEGPISFEGSAKGAGYLEMTGY